LDNTIKATKCKNIDVCVTEGKETLTTDYRLLTKQMLMETEKSEKYFKATYWLKELLQK